MGLSNSKEEQLRRMPIVQFRATKSKDGKYIIHKTTITDIKPTAYYHKVLSAAGSESVVEEVNGETLLESESDDIVEATKVTA